MVLGFIIFFKSEVLKPLESALLLNAFALSSFCNFLLSLTERVN